MSVAPATLFATQKPMGSRWLRSADRITHSDCDTYGLTPLPLLDLYCTQPHVTMMDWVIPH